MATLGSSAGVGIGTALTSASSTIVGVGAAAIASFLLLFACAACRQTNEIVIARRCILWSRGVYALLLAGHGIQLHYELLYPAPALTLPTLGALRPVAGIVACFLHFFVNSHPCFRWLVLAAQPLLFATDIYSGPLYGVEIRCREAGTCAKQTGITLGELRLLEGRAYASAFLELWAILLAGYLVVVMGCWRLRYPVRLFTVGKPLAQVAAPVKFREWLVAGNAAPALCAAGC
jgi:hypothetical protein